MKETVDDILKVLSKFDSKEQNEIILTVVSEIFKFRNDMMAQYSSSLMAMEEMTKQLKDGLSK